MKKKIIAALTSLIMAVTLMELSRKVQSVKPTKFLTV